MLGLISERLIQSLVTLPSANTSPIIVSVIGGGKKRYTSTQSTEIVTKYSKTLPINLAKRNGLSLFGRLAIEDDLRAAHAEVQAQKYLLFGKFFLTAPRCYGKFGHIGELRVASRSQFYPCAPK